MKKKRKNIYKLFQQVVSVLLLLLFLSIPVVQAFHYHDKATPSEASDDQEGISADVSKCKICEYAAHSQGKEGQVSYPPVLDVPLPKPIVLGIKVYARIYKFTLQGFSNKGPPSSGC